MFNVNDKEAAKRIPPGQLLTQRETALSWQADGGIAALHLIHS